MDCIGQDSSETIDIRWGEVHLWWGKCEGMNERLPELNHLLSEAELQRAASYHFPIHRDRFIARHGMLRILIGRYLSTDPKQIRFGVNQFQKPFVDNGHQESPLLFNCSHSNELVLYAFTRGRRIGVDIEFMRPMEDMDAVVNSCLSSDEKAQFNELPVKKRRKAFYRCWTQKEAFVKALGDGLSRRLDHFDVALIPGAPAELKSTAWDQYEAADGPLERYLWQPGTSLLWQWKEADGHSVSGNFCQTIVCNKSRCKP